VLEGKAKQVEDADKQLVIRPRYFRCALEQCACDRILLFLDEALPEGFVRPHAV
jgi:hypothetical protein